MTQPRLLAGRYELDVVVGTGGMAEVFRARDIRLDRIVGIKALRSDLADDQMLLARFRREAQSAASLNHPSIVAVYDTGEDIVGDTPVPYIVMEFVEGRSLLEVLRDESRLLPERAAAVTDGVLSALDYSHRHGIVHRDIKPGNVMLTPSGDVKVMDFGIARAASDAEVRLTRTAQVIGTARYLSPEQAKGERVDARSDLYATGCVLYELVTGRPPFTSDSPVTLLYQHVREDPVPPSRAAPGVPAWADAIVLKAMQKDPAQRYSSAEEMRDDIRRAVAGASVAAPRRKAWPWVTVALGCVLLAAAILGIAFLTAGNKGVGVPRVTRTSLVKAEIAITRAGLRVGTVSAAWSASVAKNDVISTNPSYATRVSKGSAVNLVVSKGREPVGSPSRSRHSDAASPAPEEPSPGTSSPSARSAAASSPSPAATPPSPSPSADCVVDILGICV